MKATQWMVVFASSVLLVSPVAAQQPGDSMPPGRAVPLPPQAPPAAVRVAIQRTVETETWTGEVSRGVQTETLIRDGKGRERRELPDGTVELRLPGKAPIVLNPAKRTYVDMNKPQKAHDPKQLSAMEAQARVIAEKMAKARKVKGQRVQPETPHPVRSESKADENLPDQVMSGRKVMGRRQVTAYGEGPVEESSREVWRDKENGQIMRSVDVHRFTEEAAMGNAKRPIKTQTTTTEFLYMDTRSITKKLFEVPATYKEQ